MGRATFVCRVIDGKQMLVPKHQAMPLDFAPSGLPMPMIAGDTMAPAEHPLDGRMYDSKSGFRAVTKAHGYTEMGNDPARLRPRKRPEPDASTISDHVEKAFARVERGETV